MKDPVPLFGALLVVIVLWHVFKFMRAPAPSDRKARRASPGSTSSAVSSTASGPDCSDGGGSCGGDGGGGGGD